MKFPEAKEQFIKAWGQLGSEWGINRTMAQVHALLLIAPEPLSAEEIMEQLHISRGNANMNLRALIDWDLVEREFRQGERKEYFVAEKDMWKVAMLIASERRKRELEPVRKLLDKLDDLEGDKKDKNIKAFLETINGISDVADKADRVINAFIKADQNWVTGTLLKLVK